MKSNLDQERYKELKFEIPRPRVSHHTMLELTGYQLAIYLLVKSFTYLDCVRSNEPYKHVLRFLFCQVVQ